MLTMDAAPLRLESYLESYCHPLDCLTFTHESYSFWQVDTKHIILGNIQIHDSWWNLWIWNKQTILIQI